jgi:hypothetical protein
MSGLTSARSQPISKRRRKRRPTDFEKAQTLLGGLLARDQIRFGSVIGTG